MFKVDTGSLSKRILALDLLRGYFLCVIIIDHLFRFPNIFGIFTGRGQLWVSAAEGFFIISGILVGYLYGSRILSDFSGVLDKIWKRAGKLYLISVILTLLFTAWGSFLPTGLIQSGIWPGGSITKMITAAITLRYVYGWADFLPYYAAFLFFAPFALYLVKKFGSLTLIFTSLVIWLFRGSNFYFAWQVLFMLGLVAGVNLPGLESSFLKLNRLLRNRITLFLSGLSLLTAGLSVYFVFVRNVIINVFDKDTLGPGRLLLSLVWFTSAYIIFRSKDLYINKITKGIFNVFGRNSLFIYSLHSLVLFPVNLIFPYSQSLIINSLITILILGLIYVVTAGYKHVLLWIRNFILDIQPVAGTPYLLRLPGLLILTVISSVL